MSDALYAQDREAWITQLVEDLLDGAYYVTYHRSGKAQVNLDESGRKAWAKLRAMIAVERDGGAA